VTTPKSTKPAVETGADEEPAPTGGSIYADAPEAIKAQAPVEFDAPADPADGEVADETARAGAELDFADADAPTTAE
jgi:hypothetical protein